MDDLSVSLPAVAESFFSMDGSTVVNVVSLCLVGVALWAIRSVAIAALRSRKDE